MLQARADSTYCWLCPVCKCRGFSRLKLLFSANPPHALNMEDEVLLPPPRRPEATPLSNSDFRKFLDTPRRDAPAPSLGQQQRQNNADAAGQAQKTKKPYRPRRKPEAEEKADEDDLYRQDRLLLQEATDKPELQIPSVLQKVDPLATVQQRSTGQVPTSVPCQRVCH